MSNNRYTGPKAEATMAARREAARGAYDILSKSPEEIVNEIVSDLGLDDRYRLGSDGRVGTGYRLTTPEERASASARIQEELMRRGQEAAERTSQQSQKPPKKTRRRVRYDRIAVLGIAMTLIVSFGYAAAKEAIKGAKGDCGVEEISKSDSVVPETTRDEYDNNSTVATDIVPDVNGGLDSQYQVSDLSSDRISYVIDFMDYYNPSQRENINQMIDQGMIDGLGIRIGGSKEDYPFTIKDFTDEKINAPLQRFIDAGQLELDHRNGLELAQAEEYILKAPVTIPYYLTCCIDREEAAIEAECIEATYNLMYKDMQGYDFKGRMAPLAIDIEDCGEIKLAKNEDYLAKIGAMAQRTDAVLYLIDSLREKGIIDERGVIIYGDLNRMKDKTQIDWEGLFKGLDDRNINVVKWGTRAMNATYNDPNHPEEAVKYENVYTFRDALMNTATNISYMKTDYGTDGYDIGQYLTDIAIQQIHLDQQMETDTYGEKYDINITTKNTLDAIVKGNHIDHSKGFIDKIEEVRMQEVRNDITVGDTQVENYVPDEYRNSQSNRNDDDGDR